MHVKIKQLFRTSIIIKFNPYFGWLAFHPYIIIILPKYKLYVTDTVVKHSLIVGYADDHTLLKIIPDKSDRVTAASQLNEDLEAISQFGKIWQIRFAPNKTFSLLISLKRDLLPNPHPPLTMDDTIIPESNSIKVLGF